MKEIFRFGFIAGVVVLAGCGSLPPEKPLSVSNPANPAAAAGVYPAATPVLMTETNYAMAPEPAAGEMRQHHGDSMPAMESMPSAEHKHQSHGEQP